MTNPETSRRSPSARFRRGALLVAIGALLGAAGSRLLEDAAPDLTPPLFADDGIVPAAAQGGATAEYEFLTFRRNIWVVHRPTGNVQFFMFPEDDEQQLIRSRMLQIDPVAFPMDQARFQISERNLTSFLWVMNPHTGKAQYVRAGRDGVLEPSVVENLAKHE